MSKIAVVVPVYKAENFLSRCLDSLVDQTFEDIKIICVNDASPDASSKVLDYYRYQDSRIVVINHEKNMGASAARNTGLNYIFACLPEVEYISFVDADDKIEPDTYEKTYAEAKKSDADILNFNFLPSAYWSYKTEATSDPIEYNGNCVEALFDTKEYFTYIVCWSKLYKKELLKELRFGNHKFFEDGSFAYKVLPRAKKLRVIPDVQYFYNIENPDSTCGNFNEKQRIESVFKIIQETVVDWKRQGIYDKYKYKFMDHVLNYTSLVCPNVLDDDYTQELENAFGENLRKSNVYNHLNDETKVLVGRMTREHEDADEQE